METNNQYNLEIQIPGHDKKIYPVKTQFIIGDEIGNLIIKNQSLSPKHAIFKIQNGILSFQSLGPQGSTKLGDQVSSPGKVYLLDQHDKIILGDNIFIEVHEVNQKQDLELDLEQAPTNQNSELQSSGLVVEQKDLEIAQAPKPQKPENDEVTIARLLIDPELLKRPSQNTMAKIDPNENKNLDDTDVTITAQKNKHINTISNVKDTKIEKRVPIKNLNRHSEEQKSKLEIIKGSDKKFPIKRPKINVKSQGVKDIAINPPNIFSRGFSFFFEIIFVFALYPFAKNEIFPITEKMIFLLEPFYGPILENLPKNEFITTPEHIQKIAVLAILFIAVRLFMGLVFSLPWPLFLLGYTDQGNFFGKRFKFVFTTFLNIITLPLLIFHLPILLNKRPFSEFLSGVKYEKKRKPLNIASKFFLLPLIFIICTLLPFVKDLTKLDGLSLKVDPRLQEIPPNLTITPKTLEELFQGFVPAKNTIIIPRLNFTNNGPRIHFFNLFNNLSLILGPGEKINSTQSIMAFRENNFFFSKFFPKTAVELQKTGPNENLVIENTDVLKEVALIIQASLKFQIFEAPEFLASAGPWVPSYFAFRETLLATLNLNYTPEFELKTIQNGLYLFVDNFKTEAVNTSFIIPIGNPDDRTLEFSYKKTEKKFVNVVKNIITQASQANRDNNDETSVIPSVIQSGGKATIILFNLKNQNNLKTEDENLILEFYTEAALQSINSQNEEFYNLILLSMNEAQNWIKEAENTHESDMMKTSLKDLYNKMNTLVLATTNKDVSFFTNANDIATEEVIEEITEEIK